MKKSINIILTTFSFVLLLFSLSFCEEKITITTYYPSPYGSYRDLEVNNNLYYKDPAGGAARVTTKTDNNGNFHLNSTNVSGFQIIFDDTGKTFTYYIHYTSSSGTSWCANGHIAVNYLTEDKIPANPSNLPASGYVVCLRGAP